MDDDAINKEFDVIVIGAGFCGSIIAIKAADLGLRVRIFDSRDRYPDVFRAEKLEQDQFEALEELQLIDLVRPENVSYISAVRILKGSKERVVPCHKHRGIDYAETVNSFRSVLQDRGLLEVRNVSQVEDLAEGSRVCLDDGSSERCRLSVISTGPGKALRKSLGLQSHAPDALLSTTFGFDIEPASSGPFPLQAFNVYPERFTAGLQYATFFPVGDRMRCNVFTCWKPGSPESKRLRSDTKPTLLRYFPWLEDRIGPYRLSTKTQVYTTYYYRQRSDRLKNVVLVGDAYQSVSPATGVGLSKCLADTQALLELMPALRQGSARGLEFAPFYANPRKRSVDDNALARWRWANEFSTSRSLVTTLKKLKRRLADSRARRLILHPRSMDA